MSLDVDDSPLRLTLSAESQAFQRDIRRMTTCPRCHSPAVRRSRSRTWWEAVRKSMTSRRPYRCDRCDWRGWSAVDPSREAGLRTDSPPPGPPDLRDRGIGGDDQPHQLDLLLLDEPEARSEDEHENET